MFAKLLKYLALLVLSVSTFASVAHAAPDKYVMFILDASNSMWGRVDGRPKIEIAKEVLLQAVTSLPEGTKTGLIAYGHRFNHELKECDDMELVGGYNTYDENGFLGLLDYVSPKGQTPIAATLMESIDWVSDQGAQNPTIVLITDGAESCDGDPCAAAKALADSGINAKVHVVGYDLGSEQRAQVQCIAENGNGEYFSASNAAGLQSALKEVAIAVSQDLEPVIVAQAKPEPEPVIEEPKREIFFEDEFDGDTLGGVWAISNPDPDAYIVEDSELLIISSDVQGFGTENASNLVQFGDELPKGDWDLTTNVKFEILAGVDNLFFGLYKDHENYLAIQLWGQLSTFCKEISLRLQKVASGKITQFEQRISGSKECGLGKGDVEAVRESIQSDGIYLTVSKRGRTYTASAILPGILDNGVPISFTTNPLTSLRLPGQPSFGIGIWTEAEGETAAKFDRVEIVSVE